MRNLPSIVSKLPNDLKQFLERVREALGKGEIVTKEELIQAGIVRPGRGGAIESVDGSPIIPPAAFNVTATGAMTSIFVEFDYPEYRGHAYAEIWRAETNNLGLAQMVGQTPGKFYADAVGGAAVRWYWVRLVSTTDTAGPYNGTEGTRGETSSSPSYLLSLLTNQLTTSQLTSGLSARIDMIDAADTVNGSVNSRIKLTQDALQAQINAIANIHDYDNATTYSADDMVKYNGALYRATQGTTGNLPTNTTYWTKIGDYTSLGEAVAGLSGKIDAVNYVNAGSTSVSAQTLASLQAQVNDATTGLPYAHARITSESSARATADSAMATQISTLQSTVGGNTASIQTQATTINGLSAQHTVKIDNNGYVTGYGLASAPVDGVPVSEFAVVADKFTIAPVATNPSAADGSPFFYLTAPTTINGVSIPAGAYMKSAYIHDASITNAKIANLSAEKITAGDIAADRMSANAIQAVNLSAQYIHADRIDTPTLTAKLAAIETAYIDEANITNGAITNAKIGEFIQSNNYAANSAGWRIDKGGVAEFQNVKARGDIEATSLNAATGTFTGTLQAATGTFGGQLMAGVLDLALAAGSSHIYDQPGTYSFTVPAGMAAIRITCVGAGGGGGGGGNGGSFKGSAGGAGGGGGGSGVVNQGVYHNVPQGTVLTIVVGAGGSGGRTSSGSNGQSSYVTGYLSSAGGNGGGVGQNGGGAASTGGAGGHLFGGQKGGNGGVNERWHELPENLGNSYWVYEGFAGAGGIGGASGYGAAGSGGASPARPQQLGAQLPNANLGTGGVRGSGGGGGSGGLEGRSGGSGGAGGNGLVIVEAYNPNAVVLQTTFKTFTNNHFNALAQHVGRGDLVFAG